MFQPWRLSRSLRLRRCWGEGAAGVCGPAAASGGHWLLVGSEPLPEVAVGSGEAMQDLHDSSQIIHANASGRARGTGSYEGPHMNQA